MTHIVLGVILLTRHRYRAGKSRTRKFYCCRQSPAVRGGVRGWVSGWVGAWVDGLNRGSGETGSTRDDPVSPPKETVDLAGGNRYEGTACDL